MNRLFYILLLLSICFSNFYAQAIEIKNGIFAAKVVDLESNKVVYQQNADKLMLPASNQKLFTAYAALKILGPDYRFKTKLLTDNPVKNETIDGNLYIKFEGDPEFTSTKLASLIGKLKDLKVKKIKGDIIIDDTEFDREYFGHGWSVDQTKFCFSAPISAITIDDNCFQMKLQRAKGDKIKAMPIKKTFFHSFQNSAIILKESDNCELELIANSNNQYTLYGCHKEGEQLPILNIAVQNPRILAKKWVGHLMEDKKILYHSIRFAKAPSNAKKIISVSSRRVADLVKTLLKNSDNLISEVLIKKIGKTQTRWPGSWKSGIAAVENLISTNTKINHNELIIKDGSGASRKNLVTPNQIVNLLQSIYRDSSIYDTYLGSLAITGKSGTLQYRLKNTPLEGKVYAKTGTMDYVSSLSGYAFLKNKSYVFSILTNNTLYPRQSLLKTQDEFLLSTLTE